VTRRSPLAAAALLAILSLGLLGGAPTVDAASDLKEPPTQSKPPSGFERSARQVIAIAARTDEVQAERRRRRGLEPTAYTKGPGRWQVGYFAGDKERAQVIVDDRSGAVLEAWTGPQVAWSMARGYEGAFGRKLNAPYVWIPLCVMFLLPFFDPRRPFRLLHLDLLVLLAFGASHVFFNRGEIDTSVPLVYPVLLYLLVRVLLAGFRRREHPGPLVPIAPATWLAIGLVFLVAFRIGLNVTDSNVIDVGYAGVIGADRIADGDQLYGEGEFPDNNAHGDTYGAANYLAYLPFEQVMPWSGDWDDLPAAHTAAVLFDLVTIGGLLLLGRRLRPESEGRRLGLALAFAWSAFPYTLFVLSSNANDTLVSMLVVLALLALTMKPARASASAAARGGALALGTAAKFAPLALAPLFARGVGKLRLGSLVVFGVVFALVTATLLVGFLPDGGWREFYDRTVGFQANRDSPFSVWGQFGGLETPHTVVKAAVAALALLVAFVPRRRDVFQVAALGAAVLIGLQLTADHWFYLYVVWFLPFVLVTIFAPYRGATEGEQPRERAGPDELASSSQARRETAVA